MQEKKNPGISYYNLCLFFCRRVSIDAYVGSVLYERLKKKLIFDPKSGVVEEATPETYVEDTYVTKF